MASIPLAFSIHNFISSVGADAGFAAIIGLAVLILLYFAHARETANLREEAALLTQRLMQAEARVAQLSRAQSAPAPVPAVAQAPPVAFAPASFPFAPAGVGAPAVASATRVVALAGAAAPPAAGRAAPAAARQPARALEPAPSRLSAAAAPEPSPPGPFERPAASPVAAPAAATVAGGNGAGHDHPVASPIAAEAPPPLRPPAQRAAQAGRGQLPPLRPPSRSRSRFGRGLVALVGAAGIAAVIAVLVIATSGGTSRPRSTPPAKTTNAPAPRKHPTAPPFSPSSVTVAVLNGTNTNQLAHRIATQLATMGYKEGNVATAANQNETTTIVAYFPGAQNRIDALHVAAALKLASSAVQPIDPGTQQVACQGITHCAANVVVTVGADLATS